MAGPSVGKALNVEPLILPGSRLRSSSVGPEPRTGARGRPHFLHESGLRASMTSRDSGTPGADAPETGPRCGYVTLLGAPNAGKSTILNALVGEDLSIVASRPQTTWRRITGILTAGTTQLVFLDTPGVVAGRSLLDRSLLHSVRQAVREADVLVLLLDPRAPLGGAERAALAGIAAESPGPRIGVVNKVDAVRSRAVEAEARWLAGEGVSEVYRVSARKGTGLGVLLDALRRELPPGPFLFPADEIASAPERFFVGEIVRGAIFEQYSDELPYASICSVGEMRDAEGGKRYVQVTVYVERASQKGILIGRGGRAIRRLGTAARGRIEDFLGGPVYLDLWVKVLPGWRRKPAELRRFGLPVPRAERPP